MGITHIMLCPIIAKILLLMPKKLTKTLNNLGLKNEFFYKKLSSSILYSNIFIILYTLILSFFCFSEIFGIKRLWFYFLWVIHGDDLIIMYVPILFFITQIFFTLRSKREIIRKIILQTLNLIFIYTISYFIFYIIFFSFFYNGE